MPAGPALPRYRRFAGFTLIELLVAIAIVGVLVSIALPAIGKARRAAYAARELSAGAHVMLAYTMYADDAKGALFPGYVPATWVASPPIPGEPSIGVVDEAGNEVTGVAAQRYPWRIAPYMNFNFGGLFKDEKVLRRYLQRSDFQYVISLSPSFGLNSTYLGGDADRLGFNATALRNFGAFYQTRLDQAPRADRLIAFATCKGVNPDGGELVPGFFRADAPSTRIRNWLSTPPRANPSALPGQYGNIDYRHDGKAACVYLDGHVKLETFESLDDMTRWSFKATSADWMIPLVGP